MSATESALSPTRKVAVALMLAASWVPVAGAAWFSYQGPPSEFNFLLAVFGVPWLAVCFSIIGLILGRFGVRWWAVVSSTAVTAAIFGFTPLPFNLRFWDALPTLRDLESAQAAGYALRKPAIAGTFRIIKVEKRRHALAFWMEGETAFVKSKTDPTDLFNTWSSSRLSEDWWYVVED